MRDLSPIQANPSAIVRQILLALAVTACAGTVSGESTTPTNQETTTSTSTPTTSSTSAPTTSSTTTLQQTTTSVAADLGPEAIFELWKTVFESTYLSIFTDDFPDVLEDSYFWIDSVDRVTYNNDDNTLLVETTVLFEGIYEDDYQEWADDTWTLFRDYARDIWSAVVEGFEDGASDLGLVTDWPTWTPNLAFSANTGRLSVDCPGGFIMAVVNRQATQVEFESECSFQN